MGANTKSGVCIQKFVKGEKDMKKSLVRLKKELPFHLMMLPGVILLFIFSYIPLGGLALAFQKFIPAKGLFGEQKWVGFDNFEYLLKMPDFSRVLYNTLYISFLKIVAGIFFAVFFAILINEVRKEFLKKTIQTIVYLPHFLSWVILATIFVDMLSPSEGIINKFLQLFGIEPIFFLGDNNWFPHILVITDTWKEFGFGTIIYMAAITTIDPSLYEACIMDGGNKWQQIWHILLPGIMPIIALMALLSIGNILGGNFDQVFNLYSPQVYYSGDILDTLVYRIGMLDANYSLSTAVGFFKSVVSLVLVGGTYYLAYKFADYRVF